MWTVGQTVIIRDINESPTRPPVLTGEVTNVNRKLVTVEYNYDQQGEFRASDG